MNEETYISKLKELKDEYLSKRELLTQEYRDSKKPLPKFPKGGENYQSSEDQESVIPRKQKGKGLESLLPDARNFRSRLNHRDDIGNTFNASVIMQALQNIQRTDDGQRIKRLVEQKRLSKESNHGSIGSSWDLIRNPVVKKACPGEGFYTTQSDYHGGYND